jgi:hypothetical protein
MSLEQTLLRCCLLHNEHLPQAAIGQPNPYGHHEHGTLPILHSSSIRQDRIVRDATCRRISIHRFIVDTETTMPAKLAIDASGAARGDFGRDIVVAAANARWAAKTAVADKDKAPFNG